MAITPTSTKSKNYQALGIDEIARDIETAFTSINSLETTVDNLPAAPTTTTVNISSAQILAMGSTPIELLPAAGVGKYYDIEKIILEYTHVTTAYTGGCYLMLDNSVNKVTDLTILQSSDNNVQKIYPTIWQIDGSNYLLNTQYQQPLNMPYQLSADANPTLGDGTLRAIITYTTRTFGA